MQRSMHVLISGRCGFYKMEVTRAVYLNKRLTDAFPSIPLFRPPHFFQVIPPRRNLVLRAR